MDIIIYTTPEKLEHKKGGDGYEEYFWYLSRPPKKFRDGERIYFATKGFIRGYFICNDINQHGEETLVWRADTWHELEEPIPCKHFQGFKYARNV